MKRKIGITNLVFFLFGILLFAGCGKKEALAEENDNEVYIAEYRKASRQRMIKDGAACGICRFSLSIGGMK